MPPATITDIAQEAGVSKATVSAVLNRKPTVSEETRSRVEKVMRRLNYRPRSAARLLRSQGEQAIGLIIKEIENPFYAEVAAGAQEQARAQGYTLVIVNSGGEAAEEVRLCEQLQRQGVAGLIISPVLDARSDLGYLYDLKRNQYPFVLLESPGGHHIKANLVDIDNVAASKKAVQHLISLGYTQILHFSGPAYSAHTRERIEGMVRAFSESHLAYSSEFVIPTGARAEDGYRVAREQLDRLSPRPVGIFCYNDLVALGAWRAFHEAGLSVPDDVALVGYDGLQLPEYFPAGLTTVQAPNREMGSAAAEMLIRHVEAAGARELEHITFETRLVERGSTCLLGQAQTVATG